jgi:hypothetical protein
MNAADVLADKFGGRASGWTEQTVAALLAHGEQGVAILPDGTLWALERANAEGPHEPLYRLVPIFDRLSAEAGDTEERGNENG